MIRLFLGRKERGKTTLAVHILAKLPRRVIFDARGMIRQSAAYVATTADGFQRGMDALEDGAISELVYSPSSNLKGAWLLFSAEIKRFIDAHPAADLGVLIDELTFVFPNGKLDDDFEWNIKCCRAEHVHFFLTCHRPSDVPVIVRSLTNYWYLFAAHQEHDVAVIEERCSPKTALVVATLRGSDYACWDDNHAHLTVHRDPSEWFVNLRPSAPLAPPTNLD